MRKNMKAEDIDWFWSANLLDIDFRNWPSTDVIIFKYLKHYLSHGKTPKDFRVLD